MSTPPPEPRPWDQQAGESAEAFAAFRRYAETGPDRSLDAVGRELGKSGSLLSRWSGRWRWVERSRAWDARLAEVRQAEAERGATNEAEERARRRRQTVEIEHRGASVVAELALRGLVQAKGDGQPVDVKRLDGLLGLIDRSTALMRRSAMPWPDEKPAEDDGPRIELTAEEADRILNALDDGPPQVYQPKAG